MLSLFGVMTANLVNRVPSALAGVTVLSAPWSHLSLVWQTRPPALRRNELVRPLYGATNSSTHRSATITPLALALVQPLSPIPHRHPRINPHPSSHTHPISLCFLVTAIPEPGDGRDRGTGHQSWARENACRRQCIMLLCQVSSGRGAARSRSLRAHLTG
ncbi:hypothetical protein NEOLEDRAFT_1127288 [Neolentinus lepideus HHB14362 ss-1]|uniref:Uncharacterized protein n=1 Tax=Neolentinus lepideus HHB14362 ss-1 TaxID=1314782 RepID=A0A165VWW6_9AGAM|nr:hypothetical protein NEOLEDRAFT_1127288 [Neolentinus lepideus HHB14362 ss-1]